MISKSMVQVEVRCRQEGCGGGGGGGQLGGLLLYDVTTMAVKAQSFFCQSIRL